jgi:hypothetical protein
MFLMFVRFPPNRRSSTPRRETGRLGRLTPGSTPAERRLKPGCVSRTAAAVAPVGQPDEALAAVLGGDHTADDPNRGKATAARLDAVRFVVANDPRLVEQTRLAKTSRQASSPSAMERANWVCGERIRSKSGTCKPSR